MHVTQRLLQAHIPRLLAGAMSLAILSGGAGVLKAQGISRITTERQSRNRLIVPANTIVPLELKNTINSKTAYAGERLYCETIFPVAKDDHILIPAHSYVQGHITEVDQPGHIMGKAQLSIRMDIIILPSGHTQHIECAIYSLAGMRLEAANKAAKDDDVGNKQSLQAPPSDESIIDESGLGGAMSLSGASEGVGGLVLLLVSRGKQILLRPGTTMEIRLTAPLNLAPGVLDKKPQAPHLRHRPSPEASRH